MLRQTGVFGMLIMAAVALAPMVAEAHGPTRQKVAETVEINTTADKVWAAIGNFQDMSWHPVVKKTEGENGNTPGAKRTLTLDGGGIINEELDRYDADGKMYKYRIISVDVKVLPVTNYSSNIRVEDVDGKAVVTWRGAFYRGYPNNDPPEDLNDETARKAVKGVYRAGLDALKAALEGAG